MPFAALLTQFSFPLLSAAELARSAVVLFLLASLVRFFRPLLSGLVRALVLTLRPRPARAQRPQVGSAG